MVAWTTPIRLICVLWWELLLVKYLQVQDLYECPLHIVLLLLITIVVIASARIRIFWWQSFCNEPLSNILSRVTMPIQIKQFSTLYATTWCVALIFQHWAILHSPLLTYPTHNIIFVNFCTYVVRIG